MGIPPGLTADHIGRAIKYIDSGGTHKFSKASKYHLVNKTTGIHYPPKAVVGIACQYLPDGRILESDEFSSGVGSGQAVHLLKKLLKDDPNYEIRELNKEPEGTEELSLRRMHWDDLKSKYGSPCRDVPPKLLNDKKIFFGGRGIWRDKQRTSTISPNADGIAMGLLHTGAHYSDALSDSNIIYDFPNTENPSTDAGEISSVKNAHYLELPLFVVSKSTLRSKVRNVHLGWVES